MNERHNEMNRINAGAGRPVTASGQPEAARSRHGGGGGLSGQAMRCQMGRVFLLIAVIVGFWSGVALAATVTLYPTTNAPTGTVTNPTNAYTNDNTSADVSSSNSALTVAGFNNTNLGVISDVTAYVKYKTSAAPSNDTYAFDAAVDGSIFSTSIVTANTTNQTAYVTTAGTSFAALTWAQVGTLAIKNTTVRSAGADGYSVNWDVAYIVVTYTPDTTAPTVSSVTVQTGLTVDVTFSEAMGTGVTTVSNYTVSGTGKGTLANNPNSVALVSGNTYRLTWSTGEMLNGGNITITVANAQDSAGNTIGSPNSGTHTGGAIGVAPTVTINQAGAQADPTGTSPINFTVVFSESVSNFATGDVAITGTAGGTKTATVTGSGTTYNVAVTGMTTAGAVIASINAGVATDAAGNGNTASTSTDNSVSWTTAPTCTRNAPTFSITPATQNVKTNQSVVYTLSVTNNDTAECADSSTFNIAITSETGDTAAFTLPSVRSATSVSVAAGANNSTVTLTVTSAVAAVDGKALTSLLTLSDAVNHSGMNQTDSVVTTVADFNPMIHSSLSTGSLKWSAQNGWGIAGGQYGEFKCATCHIKNAAPNIKRVRNALPTTTDPVAPVTSALPGTTISFRAVTGADSFGDDQRADKTTSTLVCSACHTQTSVHRYNSSAVTDTNHMSANQGDCISCHLHSKGFGASCTSCHGNPPVGDATLVTGTLDTGSATAGAHQAHTTASIACALCHSGSVGSGSQHNVDAKVTLGFVNLPTGTGGATGGSYTGQNIGGGKVAYDSSDLGTTVKNSGDAGFGTKTCAVYCHGNWTGSNGQTAVVWDGGAAVADDCNDCHGGSAATPPTAGSHQTHAGSGAGDLALACAKCHPNYSDIAHVNGDVAWALATADSKFTANAKYNNAATGSSGSVAPSSIYATCTGLYCHSDGAGGGPIQAPQWGNAGTGACGDCHNTGTAMATGKHTPHVNDGTIMANATCADCHVSTSSDGTTITGPTLHVNVVKDVTINANWDSDATASNNYTLATKTCANVYCHSSGQATPTYKSVAWTDTIGDCKACHNSDVASGTPMATGSHGAHMNQTGTNQVGWNVGCADCHSTTASSNSAIATPANHVNKTRNIGIKADADKPGCTQISCHSNGNYGGTVTYQADAGYEWGIDTLTGCAVCHGNGTLAYPTYANVGVGENSNSHADHAAYTCEECHSGTASGTALKTGGTTLHVNQAIDVAGAKFSWATGTETCSSITCHNNGTAQWGATLSCSSCHTLPLATGAHAKHYTAKTISGWDGTTFTNCTACHPDNSVAHSAVNGAIVVNAGLNPSGTSPAITCSTTTTGCHNGQATPAWNTTNIACTACHAVDGANTATVANPVSGLHGNAVASVQDHDNTLTGGCEACHVKASISGHWNGTASATADYTKAAVGITAAWYTDATGTGATRGSCYAPSNSGLAGCHTDKGEWRRLWSTDADSDIVATKTPGQAVCNVCHGQSGAWNEGTSHYRSGSGAAENKGLGMHTDASPNQCNDCHAYSSAAVHNSNNMIDFSGGGTSYTLKWGTHATNPGWYCGNCHNAQSAEDAASTSSHTYFDSLAFPSPTRATPERITYVTGTSVPEGSCFSCHGDGSAEYWPQNAGNVRGSTTMSDYNNAGEHQVHIDVLAGRLGYAAPYSDAQQKAMCAYCHGVNDGDHMTTGAGQLAEVFPVGNNKSLWGDPDNAAFNGTTYNCTTSDCHNNKDTTATYSWYAASTSTCTMCHTRATSGSNPSSGLHYGSTAPTVSGAWHDDSLSGGCVACHNSLPAINTAASTHIDSLFQGGNSQKTQMGLFATYTQTADNVGTCATTCHSGAGDNGTWARRWDASIHYVSTGAECAGCHGGFNNDWTFGSTANTTDGSVEHNRNWDGDANLSEVIGNHSNGTDKKCNTCHVYGDGAYVWGTHHRNNQITMNSTMGYQRTTTTPNYGCTSTCHSSNANHGMENSNWTLGTLAGPSLSCTSCHTGAVGTTGALKVSSSSAHVTRGTKAGMNTFNSCNDCHPEHTGGVLVPNNATVGINYTAGGRTGFRLGGSATTGTTEAEICWNCHSNITTYQTTAISEWGTNTKQTGTPAAVTAYNWGTLSTPNWTTATWYSAQHGGGTGIFAYKSAAIQSTHAANSAATTPGNDAVGNIRCSYCHDVHDTASGVVAGDRTGKPYLRGTWWTNPYPEDGAPRSNITYTGVAPFGNVPRAQASQNQLGGFQIDQNNGNPTATGGTGAGGAWTVADSAGLCWLCHNKNKAGTNVTVDSLDWFGTNDWATNGSGQINGHSNAVVGGTGSNKVNIFRTTWRAPSGLTTTGARPDMGYANHGTGVGYGYRATDARGFTGHSPPTNAGNARPYGGGLYNWGATVNDTTVDTKYHNFSCSKCHNPHASRLPRLMVTNCLDTKQNTWDNVRAGMTALTVSTTNSNNITLNATSAPDSWGRTWSNVQSAQNCHRLADPAVNPTNTTNYGRGWNNVTPW